MYLSWEKNYSNQNVGTERFFFKFPLSYVKKALKIYYQTKHYNDNIHWQASFEPLYVSKRHQRQIVVIYKKNFTMWGKKNNNRSEKKGLKTWNKKKSSLLSERMFSCDFGAAELPFICTLVFVFLVPWPTQ